MPSTEASQGAAHVEASRPVVVESRIDAPHVLGDGPAAAPPSPPSDAQAAESLPAESLALLQAQAQQLSGHLLQQQQQLDAREARLHAQLAAFENEARTSRLQLAERQHALDEAAAAIKLREQELDLRDNQLLASDELLKTQTQHQQALSQRQDEEYAARKQQLNLVGRRLVQQRLAHQKAADRLRAARRRFERDMRLQRQQLDTRRRASVTLVQMLLGGIERRRAALAVEEQSLAQREDALQHRFDQEARRYGEVAAAFQVREQRLVAAEQLCHDRQSHLENLQSKLSAEREEFESTRCETESAWLAKCAEAELLLKQQQLAVERRSSEVDARRISLEQLQAEVRDMHRESLEMRLAAEELSAQLAGVAPPALITSSIARLRGKLADHFRLAAADLSEQRHEMEQLREQLHAQHERLAAQKTDLQQWVERRQDEVEQQAARLVCREQELDWQQEQIQSLQQRWQDERQNYQQRIRDLLADLRRHDASDASSLSA